MVNDYGQRAGLSGPQQSARQPEHFRHKDDANCPILATLNLTESLKNQ